MNKTQLLYLNDFTCLTCQTRVLVVLKEQDRDVVILDQTVFYPQGGGQPYDQGAITGGATTFNVQEVRFVDGVVKHIGTFAGAPFTVEQTVICTVDGARRLLNSRLHAAGHVIDKAIFELGYDWVPGKSYHFPNGPYVEYAGSLHTIDVAKLKVDIERLCATWAADGLAVTSKMLDKKSVLNDEVLKRRCSFVTDLPDNKPIYVIAYGNNFASPCGGTHVKNVCEIGPITIRKIKESDGVVRISYELK